MGLSAALAVTSAYRSSIGGVPVEFRRKAEALRLRVMEANDEFMVAGVAATAKLRERARRSPIPRQTALVDAHRLWSCLPGFGLLYRETKLGKRSLMVHEMRVSAAKFRAYDWGGDALEPGISVVGVDLCIAAHRFDFEVPTLVSISAHALGRWYQRSIITTDDELWDDLRSMARAHAGLVERDVGATFGISVSSGARWVGHTREVEDPRRPGAIDVAAIVRTFK